MKLKSINVLLAGLLVIPMFAMFMGLLAPMDVSAGGTYMGCSTTQFDIGNGVNCGQPTGTNPNLFGPGSLFTIIVNVALFIIGTICVLMLIFGGIKYTTSAGDEKAVTSAKNTIMYAVIGIVIAILAFALVNFVIGALMPA